MMVYRNSGARRYVLRQRAERAAATRGRIARAALELHGSIGPARTTISAIARRSGVQRPTVYRHFPSVRSLLLACSAEARMLMPPPDVARWRRTARPWTRLRTGLGQLYHYFRRTERFWANILRDAEVMPVLRQIAVERRLRYLCDARDALGEGWRATGRRRARLTAALGHAVDFRTWESLARRQRLTDGQAVELMTRLVAGCLQEGAGR